MSEQPQHHHGEPPADQPAAAGERALGAVPWSITDALFTYLIWFVVIVVLGTAVLLGLNQFLPQQMANAVMLPITLMLLITATIGYVRVRFGESVRMLLGSRSPSWIDVGIGLGAGAAALLVLGLGLGLLLQLIANAMQTELPQVQETFRELAGDRQSAPWLVLSSVLVAPVAEEMFFRGMLFPALRKRLPLWPAMGISALLFGISHLQTSLEGYLLVLLIIIPLGMVLAYLYEWRRTLLVPVLVHATFNLVQVIQLLITA